MLSVVPLSVRVVFLLWDIIYNYRPWSYSKLLVPNLVHTVHILCNYFLREVCVVRVITIIHTCVFVNTMLTSCHLYYCLLSINNLSKSKELNWRYKHASLTTYLGNVRKLVQWSLGHPQPRHIKSKFWPTVPVGVWSKWAWPCAGEARPKHAASQLRKETTKYLFSKIYEKIFEKCLVGLGERFIYSQNHFLSWKKTEQLPHKWNHQWSTRK